MKRIVLLLLAAIGTISAQKHGDAHLVVHSGAKVFFQKNAELLKRLNLVIHKNSLVNGDDFNPRLMAATLKDAATTTTVSPMQALTQPGKPSAATPTVQNSEQYYELLSQVDILKGELAGLRNTTGQVSEAIDKIFRGEFNLPKTELAPQDAARLASVEEWIRQINVWRETALSELPIISVISDVSSLAALAPYLSAAEQTKGDGVGAQFTRSMTLPHDNKIEVRTSVTLDGCGESLSFANSATPQLVVEPGAQLHLENVTLKNIHAQTILIRPGGKIVCGKNVVWELNDAVTLSSGIIELAGRNTVMHVCGIGGQRHFTVRDGAEIQLFSNTIMLRDVLMSGTANIYANDDVLGAQEVQYGALSLAGNAGVAVEDILRVGVIASGSGNMLLANNNVYLGGPILFADQGHNELGILIQENGEGVAECSLGSQALYVASAHGTATLRWYNRHVSMQAHEDMAFVVGAHGQIYGQKITLQNQPIIALGIAGQEPHAVCNKELILESSLRVPISTSLADHFIYNKLVAAPLKEYEADAIRFHDRVVYTNTARVHGMAGTVVVDGGTINDWSVEEDDDLQLTLQNGATLRQGGATTISHDDQVRVKGRGNAVCIQGAVDWQGGVSCQANSELTIYCAANSHLTLNNAWCLEEGARVTLCGPGAIAIDKAAEWTLKGAQHSGGMHSSLCIRNGALVTIEQTGVMTIRGNGSIVIDEQAVVGVEQGGRLHIGMTPKDNLSLMLDRSSRINVGHVTQSSLVGGTYQAAYLSLAYGNVSMRVERESCIEVYTGSTFALNWRAVGDSMQTTGVCTQLHCGQGARIYLHDQSTMMLGQNDKRQHRRSKITWTEHGGGIYGAGMIGYAATGSTVMSPKRLCLVERMPTHCRTLNESSENIALVLTQP